MFVCPVFIDFYFHYVNVVNFSRRVWLWFNFYAMPVSHVFFLEKKTRHKQKKSTLITLTQKLFIFGNFK